MTSIYNYSCKSSSNYLTNFCQHQETIQISCFLIFRRQLRLPVDIAFELDQTISNQPMIAYISKKEK